VGKILYTCGYHESHRIKRTDVSIYCTVCGASGKRLFPPCARGTEERGDRTEEELVHGEPREASDGGRENPHTLG